MSSSLFLCVIDDCDKVFGSKRSYTQHLLVEHAIASLDDLKERFKDR